MTFVHFSCKFAAAEVGFSRQGGVGLSSAKTGSDAAAAKWASGTEAGAQLKQEGLGSG